MVALDRILQLLCNNIAIDIGIEIKYEIYVWAFLHLQTKAWQCFQDQSEPSSESAGSTKNKSIIFQFKSGCSIVSMIAFKVR